MPTVFASLTAAFVATLASAQGAPITKSAAADCAALVALQIEDVKITEASAVQPTAAQRALGRDTLCRVAGVIGKETHFIALLPDDWNRRFMMGGGGGFVGAYYNQAESSVNSGYATVGTDAGHQAPTVFNASWALNNEERQISFASVAVHRTAEVTKQIIRAYYGEPPMKSYFYGCSNGGREALMQAQRYPEDFDGIVAQAPALDFGFGTAIGLRNLMAQFPTGDFSAPVITHASLALLESRIFDACDARDGVRDSILDDPRTCDFRLASVPSCANDVAAPDCFTRVQRTAIEQIYSPLRANGKTLFPGRPLGNEADPNAWAAWITGISAPAMQATGMHAPSAGAAFATEFFKYFVFADSTWDYRRYDLQGVENDIRRAQQIVSAVNPDLSAFTARGGKLILGQGWSDPAVNALRTIQYFDAVRSRDKTAVSHVRLFMMPGVLHCVGGTGCDRVDWYAPIADWVERGVGPERILAEKRGPANSPNAPSPIVRTRPLCPYPQHAVYAGAGSTDEERSFVCK